jgi:hypothetical protein
MVHHPGVFDDTLEIGIHKNHKSKFYLKLTGSPRSYGEKTLPPCIFTGKSQNTPACGWG